MWLHRRCAGACLVRLSWPKDLAALVLCPGPEGKVCWRTPRSYAEALGHACGLCRSGGLAAAPCRSGITPWLLQRYSMPQQMGVLLLWTLRQPRFPRRSLHALHSQAPTSALYLTLRGAAGRPSSGQPCTVLPGPLERAAGGARRLGARARGGTHRDARRRLPPGRRCRACRAAAPTHPRCAMDPALTACIC